MSEFLDAVLGLVESPAVPTLGVLVLGALVAAVLVRLVPPRRATNVDRLVGRVVVVTERVDELVGTGEVSVSGIRWSARTGDVDVTVETGARVRVASVEGASLVVEKIERE